MRLQVLQVICLMRSCLVNTIVPRGPLLQSLRGLPKTALITFSGVRSLLFLHLGQSFTCKRQWLKCIMRGGGCPPISEKDVYGSLANAKILAIRLVSIGMDPMRAKTAHDLYVIQVDQRRLVDVHVDCLMRTVNSPRSPVPPNYTREVARVRSQFEEDTYNVNKILGHGTHRK